MTNFDFNNAEHVAQMMAAYERMQAAKKDRGTKMLAEIDSEIARLNIALAYAQTLRTTIATQIGMAPTSTAMQAPTKGRKSGGSGIMLEVDGVIYGSPTAAAKATTGTSAEVDGVRWFGITGTETDGQIIERKYTPRGGAERIIKAIVRRPAK